MVHIFVDFEMNSIAKELFDKIQNCHMEIIEIGAVALDDNMNEIGSYKRYIKPQYNDHIMPRYVELTGINDRTVKDAENFTNQFFDFLKWCGSFEGKFGYQMYSWSKCDRDQLKRELKQKRVVGRNRADVKWMLGHWRDYQKEFSMLLGIGHPFSLDKAVDLVGCSFVGRMHDALCDARNTSRLFISANDENFKERLEQIKEVIRKEEEEKAKSKKLIDSGENVKNVNSDKI